MNINVGDSFDVLRFTAIAQFVADTSVFFQLAHVSQSGFTRSGFGYAAVMTGCLGQHDAVVLLSLPDEYHEIETLRAIQIRLFDILSLDEDHSFYLQLSPKPTLGAHGPNADGHISLSGG